MHLTVGFECPQCGAPMTLDETTRYVHCPYCGVTNYLTATDCFRYILPSRNGISETYYMPYIRFKGTVYTCNGVTVNHRIIDKTYRSLDIATLPATLGFRPQAMTMRFRTPESTGIFLKNTVMRGDIVTLAGHTGSRSTVAHRAFIGESISLIYLPLYKRNNQLIDAVNDKRLGPIPMDTFDDIHETGETDHITVLAALCPRCGWNLEGAGDSIVLTCSNCESAWEVKQMRFAPLDVVHEETTSRQCRHIPFWRITIEMSDPSVVSYADFIRFAGLPKVVLPAWESQTLSFILPAFKIRPSLFLRLAQQMSSSLSTTTMQDGIPSAPLSPATLPREEALESIKTVIARMAARKRYVIETLPRLTVHCRDFQLLYLPFEETTHELVHNKTNICVLTRAFEYGAFV